ncbi:MAG: polyphosphate kinase 1 [Oscillospiraceae bacterium]
MKKQIYMNRELSWLKFNSRVLEEAERPDVPLCERLSFVSIYQSNLDEFFMVRIGSLIDQSIVDSKSRDNKTDMTASEQIAAAVSEVRVQSERYSAVYRSLMSKLEEQNVHIVDFKNISEEESKRLEHYYDTEIAPLISPVIVGKRQPFPFLRNKHIYAVASLLSRSGKQKLGIISCKSEVFPRLIEIKSQENTFMLSEELVLHFISKAFKDYAVQEKSLIRVTRNADIDADLLYDEDLDYREFMEDLIKKRKRLAPLRLELSRKLDGKMVDTLCRELDISKDFVFNNPVPLDVSFLFQLSDTLRQKPELFFPKRFPQRSELFRGDEPILPQIKAKDKLLSYPFNSMKPFLNMLREAANDKDVISIKMTLYRVARQSEVVEALIEAAENGKDVLVLVELKARFDEENNIGWSRRLEEAGCRVIYGLSGYKVHSKLCLITKRVEGEIEYYTQVGTGNYNEKTARLYTDYSLMTCNKEIGEDAAKLFDALSCGDTVKETKALLIAPNCLQNKVLDMIDEQKSKGEEGYIGVKINSLTDKKIIDALIDASKAGVHVDLVVRGICCLIPGIEGETENIRVISVVGRFLEHSRIYIFGKGDDRKMYIASADFMTRNTLRRVEAAAPLYDEDIRRQVSYMFDTFLKDNTQARELLPDGNYVRVQNNDEPLNAQEHFYDKAYELSSDLVTNA